LSRSYPKWYIAAPAYLWAGSVGYSRMYLGVHYPSDVFGGAVLGTTTSLLLRPAMK
jgi:undecaprenyl-diphosphatase